MYKSIIKVPSHVDKISRWEGFEELLPEGSIILNKSFPGCGMTYYYLHNDSPIILCAPRNSLLINKAKQLEEENSEGGLFTLSRYKMRYFYYYPSNKSNTEQRRVENREQFAKLKEFLVNSNNAYIPKILVTYDSLPSINSIIEEIGINFNIIMDESHVFFQDYCMKPEVIERTLSLLCKLPSVIYLSATPIMEKYLEKMEYFSDLPYVELEWPQERKRKTEINYNRMSSTVNMALKVIRHFKECGYFDAITSGGITHYSHEGVFFINNVRDVVNTIREAGLLPSEVNILVANKTENQQKIKSLGPDFSIGQIPTKGEKHKTYTFCSKVVFFGCDFYSTNASTFVFADGNSKCMVDDIALDLPQIVGRQRLEENLFRSKCHVFVKTTINSIMSESEFCEYQENRWKESNSIIKDLKTLNPETIEAIKLNNTKCPYGVIFQDSKTGLWKPKVCINILLAEQRAWELTNLIYINHAQVQISMLSERFGVVSTTSLPDEIKWFLEEMDKTNDTAKKMKMFCEFFDYNSEFKQFLEQLPYSLKEYGRYYLTLGTDCIARKGFVLSRIKTVYEHFSLKPSLEIEFEKAFGVEGRYLLRDIKEQIQKIYNDLGLMCNAKATDISLFYEVVTKYQETVNGKRLPGYEIKKKNGTI